MNDSPRRGSVITAAGGAIVPLLFGIFGIVVAAGLGVGSLNAPGPGMWPLIISVFLAVMSLGGLVRLKEDDGTEAWGHGMVGLALGLISLVVYAVLFPRIGFEIPTALLVFFWIKVLGREKWRPAIVVSLVATAVVYVIFIVALRVNLPHLF